MNSIELEFADGVYEFALPIEQIRELQRKTTGIGVLFSRISKGVSQLQDGRVLFATPHAGYFAEDIIEAIRHGLLGGGKGMVGGEEVKVTPIIANRLIENYVLTQPLLEGWKIAFSVLGACLIGYDPPKKDEPAVERAAPRRKRTKKAASTTS